MDFLRNNPIAATVVFIIAIVALLFSVYWTFLRGSTAPPQSPFEGMQAPQVAPGGGVGGPPGQEPDKQQAPMAF